MQAANDNLQEGVSGVDEWEPLHVAVRKVVEACAWERAASHQVAVREDAGGKTESGHQSRAPLRLISSNRFRPCKTVV